VPSVRRKSLVAGAVLTAALALGALPEAVGSSSPTTLNPIPAGAFQSVHLSVLSEGPIVTVNPPDPMAESASHLEPAAILIEPGSMESGLTRPTVTQTQSAAIAVRITVSKPAVAVASRPSVKPVVKRIVKATIPVKKPAASPRVARQVLHGLASWYDNGTTAMRLPRGTHIRICGERSCVNRVVTDWGPASWLPSRVVDLMPSDFVAVTGLQLGAGLANVTVYIY
jgi:hypothetical protein